MPLKLTLSLSFLGTNEFHLSSLLHDEKKKKKKKEEEEEGERERERERERELWMTTRCYFSNSLFLCVVIYFCIVFT